MAIGVALLGAPRLLAQTYLLNEGFEGASFENTGWTTFSNSDPDYAASPLVGSQSLRCNGTSSFIQRPLALGSSFYCYFQVRWLTYAPFKFVMDWLDSSINSVSRVVTDGFPNRLNIVHGGASVTGTTVLAANTTYHVWVEWTRGTGANGTMSLFVSTTGVKPGSPEATITTGSGINPIAAFDVGPFDAVASTDVIYDRILIDDEPIGSNPGGTSPPSITVIANQITPVSTAIGPIPFTIGDAETNANDLVVTGASSNTGVVPNANIIFGGSGSNRTVTITPASAVTANTTITITVSDGQSSSFTSFTLTVGNANAPGISAISNQSTPPNTAVGPINFVIGDVETSAASLTLLGFSTDTTLVPNANIVFGGSGSNRTVTLTPTASQSGVTLVTVFVSDGELTNSTSFMLTVSAANTPPTISDVANQSVTQDTTLGPINFTVGDAETPAASLTVTRASSNPVLVPVSAIDLGGSGANRTVTITPTAGLAGTSTITLTVSDGDLTASDSFVLTITATNPPTGNPGEWLLREGFEGAGYENPDWTELNSPNPDYSTLALKGAESLNLANGCVIMRTFRPTNAYSLYCRLRWNRFAKGAILYYFETADYSPAASLLTDFSADRLLLSHGASSASGATDLQANVTYHVWMEWTLGTGGNGTLKLFLSTDVIKPVLPEASVTTGTGEPIERLYIGSIDPVPDVIVDSILIADEPIGDNPDGNATPTISDITGQTIDEDSSTGPVSFVVGDRETAASSLTVSGASSNQALVPDSNIIFGGSGSNRTVTVTPLPDQSGTAEISVTVSDGALSANDTFVLTVHPMPDDPELTWLNPDPITYGVPLSSTQLNAVANVPGLFTYTPPGGTILNAGAGQTLAVTFVPDDAVNYNSVGANVTISVTRAALLVSANSTNRPYGQTNPPFTASFTGFVNGDDAGDLEGQLIFSTLGQTNSPIGSYEVSPSGLASTNYMLNFAAGTLTITAAPLMVTVDDEIKVYGAALPELSGDLAGVQNADNLSATFITVATAASDAGSYTISPLLADPDGKLSNYAVTTNLGMLTITPAPLLISANDTNRPYGTANPPFTASYAGLVNGDDETDLDSPVALSTSATAASPAGRHAITTANAADLNYAITFVEGTLTITPAGPLTLAIISADALGNATLRITSDPGQRIKLLASTDLTDWIDLVTLENATGAIDHLDSGELGGANRFYRAVLAPE
jgi:hypothetical protein